MPKLMSREDLDRALCSTPGCPHGPHEHPLYLHSRCHPEDPLDVAYQAGVLLLSCHLCHAPLVAIAVAEGAEP